MSAPGSLPAYQQITEMLLREISAGRLVDGMRFPPERQQAEALGVSVGTLRKSLAELENQGFLERRQGSGNYVRVTETPEGIYKFFRLERLRGGGLPTAELIDLMRCAKPGDLPQFGADGDAFRIRRLRALDGTPVAAEEIWLDGARATRITAAQVSESLYQFYRDTLGFWIARIEDRIGVAVFPDWAPAELLEKDHRAGFVERWGWAQDGVIAEYSRTWFDSSRARYVSRLK